MQSGNVSYQPRRFSRDDGREKEEKEDLQPCQDLTMQSSYKPNLLANRRADVADVVCSL